MQTRIEVEKTYWVGMTHDQVNDLGIALVAICGIEKTKNSLATGEGNLTQESLDVLNDLRLAILNV